MLYLTWGNMVAIGTRYGTVGNGFTFRAAVDQSGANLTIADKISINGGVSAANWSWTFGGSPESRFDGGIIGFQGTGEALPTFGSIVQDIGFGWAIRPNIEEYTELNDRMMNWGQVRRKISNSQTGFSGGADSVLIADTDQAVWGSFYGAAGSNPLWKKVSIKPYAISSLYGTVSGNYPVFTGRIIEVHSKNNTVKLGLFDEIDRISKGKFIWDYTPLKTTEDGTLYGTVVSVNGSAVIIEETPNDTLRKTILNTDLNKAPTSFNAGEKWRRLGNLGLTGTDYIYPGDLLKFSGTDLAAADAGSVLLNARSYRVGEGSFFVDRNRTGTFGTLILNAVGLDVKPGDFVYKEKPLWFRGHPAEVIRQFLVGSNTTLGFGTNIINESHYSAATSWCPQFYVESLIEDKSEGAIVNAIKHLSKITQAVYFFDINGSFVWMPNRPRTRDSLDVVAGDYWGTVYGGTEGTGNMFNAEWGHSADGVLTDVEVRYSYNHLEDERFGQWKAQVTRQNLGAATGNNGLRIHGTIETPWVVDADTAVYVAENYLREHATARPTYTFDTSLYGIEQDLYDLLTLTHRTGSMSKAAWSVGDVRYAIDEDQISFTLYDVSHLYFGAGYGYFMAGSGTDSVSGTSKSGWGWPITTGPGTHGTVGPIASGSLGSLIVLWDNDGLNPSIGAGGFTQYISVGSEILKVTSVAAAATKTILRGQETTASHIATIGTGDGWFAWPMREGIICALYNGTENLSNVSQAGGTVHGINTATFGSVFRFF
jgi:hypothetical protein